MPYLPRGVARPKKPSGTSGTHVNRFEEVLILISFARTSGGLLPEEELNILGVLTGEKKSNTEIVSVEGVIQMVAGALGRMGDMRNLGKISARTVEQRPWLLVGSDRRR